MHRHFTASCFVIRGEKVLMLLHKKIKKWLPPGGHIERDETPPEAALRETFEETGLHIDLFKQEEISVMNPNSCSLERPFLCLLEEIPPHGTEEAHQHMDFIYVGYPKKGSIKRQQEESDKIRYFTLDEVKKLARDEIYDETKEIIIHIFRNRKKFRKNRRYRPLSQLNDQ